MVTKALILGEGVSTTARSPKVWKSLYKELQLNGEMTPIDVTMADLEEVFIGLVNSDVDCGLIASPLKSSEVWLNGFPSELVKLSQAANFFWFDSSRNLHTENFDGEGALLSLGNHITLDSIKKILICGSGPVARSLVASLQQKSINEMEVLIATRHFAKAQNWALANKLKLMTYPQIEDLSEYDLIINATPIGGKYHNHHLFDTSKLGTISGDALYFDVNYNNAENVTLGFLSSLGKRVLDGKEMNSYQAALAFIFAHNLNHDVESLVTIIQES